MRRGLGNRRSGQAARLLPGSTDDRPHHPHRTDPTWPRSRSRSPGSMMRSPPDGRHAGTMARPTASAWRPADRGVEAGHRHRRVAQGRGDEALEAGQSEIIDASDDDILYEEGCLGARALCEVTRPAASRSAIWTSRTRSASSRPRACSRLHPARDRPSRRRAVYRRISSLRRSMILRKLVKARKQAATESV